jgi:SAM-dependent methyltransferase
VVRAWQTGRRIFQRLEDHLRPGDRVFEVGAGIGCTVKAFELAGFDASGIEPGECFQVFSHDQLRCRVSALRLEDMPPTPAFDLVLLVHVLEHLNSPTKAFRRIRQILKPGGRLYVECPNLAAPHAAPGKLFHFAHIFTFTPSTLVMLGQACGFRVQCRMSHDRDRNLMFLFARSDEAEMEIGSEPSEEHRGQGPVSAVPVDPASYCMTTESLRRYTTLTYHLRWSYLAHRAGTLARHASQHVLARRRMRRIVERCSTIPAPAI